MLTLLGTILLGVVVFIVLVYVIGFLIAILVGSVGLVAILIKYATAILLAYFLLKWFGLIGKKE